MATIVKLIFLLILLGLYSCKESDSERIVSFDDFDLHIKDNGTGKPTVIIEAGLGFGLMHYDTLQTLIPHFTRVISYDRPGLGNSTQSPNPRILPNYVNELKQFLDHEKIKPPYILVGHSLGGLIIRYFTHMYPDHVAGLVFIDHPHEDWFEYIRTTHAAEDIIKFNKIFDPSLNQTTGIIKEEWEQYEINCELIKGIEIPSQIPVRMITAIKYGRNQESVGYHRDDMKVWADMQASIIENVQDAEQIITTKSGHSIHLTEPELVVNAIKELVLIYRKGEVNNY
ncbi:alpha/beta fold hydrolase [Carboxylicivirga marina]|uniref:Alpha/beta hydrolase n=1 Tax=Carboxylicivirga marina TaxID=2800988 RepID=A0ABS1HHT3_9BACT|nr:alpha/beta hydrolase [Carboxylicivirga marina]MBK3517181.1 alpha/beta hydrolase [Carboxylicivirga marina]